MPRFRPLFPLLFSLFLFTAEDAISQNETTLRADVEQYLASLSAAWKSGDRQKVYSHFEHSELMAPTESEYAMLGKLRFWDKPIKSIEAKDGVIHLTVTLDPEADSPSRFLTLQLIRDTNGKLLMKSTATPEQLAAAVENRKKELEWERDVAGVIKELERRKPIQQWPLLEALLRIIAEQRGPLPANAGFIPLAEAYRGDDAVLLAMGFEGDNLRDPEPFVFTKRRGKWVSADGNGEETAMALLQGGSQDIRTVRRAPGFSLEQLPLFILYQMRDQPRNYKAAYDANDWNRCAAILDETLVGFSLQNLPDVLSALRSTPRPLKKVTLVSAEPQPDGRLLAAFEMTGEESSRRVKLFLAKSGNGWVIDERYNRKALATLGAMRTLMVTVEAFAIDHGNRYPIAKSIDDLRANVEPTYIHRMPKADAWGTPFRYEVAADGKSYRLVSAGADKTFKPERWSLTGSVLDDLTEDAVASNGTIVRMWTTDDGS